MAQLSGSLPVGLLRYTAPLGTEGCIHKAPRGLGAERVFGDVVGDVII